MKTQIINGPKLLGLIWIIIILLSFGALSYDLVTIFVEWISPPTSSSPNPPVEPTPIITNDFIEMEYSPEEPSWFKKHQNQIIIGSLVLVAIILGIWGYSKISAMEDRINANQAENVTRFEALEEASNNNAQAVTIIQSQLDGVEALNIDVATQGTELKELSTLVHENVSPDMTRVDTELGLNPSEPSLPSSPPASPSFQSDSEIF